MWCCHYTYWQFRISNDYRKSAAICWSPFVLCLTFQTWQQETQVVHENTVSCVSYCCYRSIHVLIQIVRRLVSNLGNSLYICAYTHKHTCMFACITDWSLGRDMTPTTGYKYVAHLHWPFLLTGIPPKATDWGHFLILINQSIGRSQIRRRWLLKSPFGSAQWSLTYPADKNERQVVAWFENFSQLTFLLVWTFRSMLRWINPFAFAGKNVK